jgi:DnaJ-class molecular chaperone
MVEGHRGMLVPFRYSPILDVLNPSTNVEPPSPEPRASVQRQMVQAASKIAAPATQTVKRLDVGISLEEAAFGCQKNVTYDRMEPCHDCAGQIPTDSCKVCRGAGMVSRARTIEVIIPSGVANGDTRIVERGGDAIFPDRSIGNLELTIRVQPHEIFRREGDDIVFSFPFSFPIVALGGEVELPTLDGNCKLRVPPGTQAGTILRGRGRGMPRKGGSRGDLLVEVNVEVPRELTPLQEEVIGKLAEALKENAPAPWEKIRGEGGMLSRVSDFLRRVILALRRPESKTPRRLPPKKKKT